MLAIRFTGLDKVLRNFDAAPANVKDEVRMALGRSVAFAEGEAKRRTPVDTGNLRSSIGGAGGYRFVEDARAGVGTNVKYAFWVEVRENVRHAVGEAGYMMKGATAAAPYIQMELEKAARRIAQSLVK